MLAISSEVDLFLKSLGQMKINKNSNTIDHHWSFNYISIFYNYFKADQN